MAPHGAPFTTRGATILVSRPGTGEPTRLGDQGAWSSQCENVRMGRCGGGSRRPQHHPPTNTHGGDPRLGKQNSGSNSVQAMPASVKAQDVPPCLRSLLGLRKPDRCSLARLASDQIDVGRRFRGTLRELRFFDLALRKRQSDIFLRQSSPPRLCFASGGERKYDHGTLRYANADCLRLRARRR